MKEGSSREEGKSIELYKSSRVYRSSPTVCLLARKTISRSRRGKGISRMIATENNCDAADETRFRRKKKKGEEKKERRGIKSKDSLSAKSCLESLWKTLSRAISRHNWIA